VLASVVFNCNHLSLVQLKGLEAEVLEVMVVPSQNLNPHPAGTCTNQDVAHQIIEDSAQQVSSHKLSGLGLKELLAARNQNAYLLLL